MGGARGNRVFFLTFPVVITVATQVSSHIQNKQLVTLTVWNELITALKRSQLSQLWIQFVDHVSSGERQKTNHV